MSHFREITPKLDGTGCIEDRIIIERNGEPVPEGHEVHQAPGGDAFFALLEDIEAEAREPGSVQHSFTESLEQTLEKLENPTVHNDSGHGGHYDGCGFLGKFKEILSYTAENGQDLINEINEQKPDVIENTERTLEYIEAIGRLADREGYVDRSGGDLVQYAVEELGANLLTYDGEHVAGYLHANTEANTQDIRSAHEEEDPGFNVDSHYVRSIADEKLELQGENAEAIAIVLARGTTEVLAPGLELEVE